MSQIDTVNIDATFPKQGQDNPSAGFRENFSAIKVALDNAKTEITALQTDPSQSLITLGDGLAINTTTGATTLVPSTSATIGGVIIGEGILVDQSGTISVALLEPATTTTLGGIIIGTGLSVDINGVISGSTATVLVPATTSTLGGIKVGQGVFVAIDGTLNVTTASSLPVASTTTNGIVRIGSGILVSATGTISVQAYTLPTASSSVKGGVIVYPGGSIAAQPDGTISVNIIFSNGTGTQYAESWPNNGVTPPSIWWDLLPATTSTLGGVIPDGTSITIDPSGVISSVGGGSPFNGGTITSSLIVNNSTSATSTNSGALQVVGGVGIAGDVNIGGKITSASAAVVNGIVTANTLSVTSGNINVTNSGLNLIGTYTDAVNGVGAVAIQGNFAYVVGGFVLSVLDISNPSSPILLGTFNAGTSWDPVSANRTANSIVVQGKYAYVIGSPVIRSFDISVPSNIQSCGWIGFSGANGGNGGANAGYYAGLASMCFPIINGNYIYTTFTFGLSVTDITDPYNMRVLSATGNYAQWGWSTARQGNYVYTGTGGQGLSIWDITNAAAPTWVSSTNPGIYPYGIGVYGKYAYLCNWGANAQGNVFVYDVTNPSVPVLVNNFGPTDKTNEYYQNFRVFGNYGYGVIAGSTARAGSIDVYDMANSANPTLLYNYSPGVGQAIISSAPYYVYNNHLYAVTGSQLQIIELPSVKAPGLSVSAAKIGALTVRNNADVYGSLNVNESINAGTGGLSSDGPLNIRNSAVVKNQLKVGNFYRPDIYYNEYAGAEPYSTTTNVGLWTGAIPATPSVSSPYQNVLRLGGYASKPVTFEYGGSDYGGTVPKSAIIFDPNTGGGGYYQADIKFALNNVNEFFPYSLQDTRAIIKATTGNFGVGTTQPFETISANGNIVAASTSTLSSELITDGVFATNPGPWTFGSGWTLDTTNQWATHSVGSGTVALEQSVGTVANSFYQIQYTVGALSTSSTLNLVPTALNTWGNNNLGSITTGVSDPLGGTSAWALAENTANNYHAGYQLITLTAGNAYTFTAYGKLSTAGRYITLSVGNSGNGAVFISVTLDPSNGTLTPIVAPVTYCFSNYTAAVTTGTNGWYQVSLTFTCLQSLQYYAVIGLSNVSQVTTTGSLGQQSYTGTNATAINVYGPVFQQFIAPGSNLISSYYNNNFSAWNNAALVSVTQGATDPFGGSTAWTLTEQNQNNWHAVYLLANGGVNGTLFANNTYSFSSYGQLSSSTRYLTLSVVPNGYSSNFISVTLDPSVGTITPVVAVGQSQFFTNYKATVSTATSGWYQVTLTFTALQTLQYYAVIGMSNVNSVSSTAYNGQQFYSGNGTSSIKVYGSFVQQLPSLTGSVTPQIGSTSASPGTSVLSNNYGGYGNYTVYLRAADTTNLKFIPTTDFNGYIDNVSVKQMLGGNVIANGLFTGGGALGVKVDVLGNVGIKNSAPGYELDVAGTINSNNVSTINLTATGNVKGVVNVVNSAPSAPIKGTAWFDTSVNTLKIYDGSTWQSVISSGSNSLPSRTTITTTSTSLAASASQSITLTAFKTYAISSITVDKACWIRIYSDAASQSTDLSRPSTQDAAAGTGLITEIITVGAITQKLTPFVVGGNLEAIPNTNLYLTVTNFSGSTTVINTSITLTQMEL